MKPLRALFAALAAFAVFAALLLPRDALAIGTVKVEDTSPQEIDGRWKLSRGDVCRDVQLAAVNCP